jgi:hypothetical protein
MCEIVVAEKENKKLELVKLARENRLYVPSKYYHLYTFFKRIMDSNNFCIDNGNFVRKISIAFENGAAVGVCLLIKDGWNFDKYTIEVFVKKSFRRMGIGTILLLKTKTGLPEKSITGHETGMPQAKLFWGKNNIKTI